MSSQDNSHNILITLVSIGIGILLVNTILLINHTRNMTRDMTDMRVRDKQETVRDNWEQAKGMFDNGGVYNGISEDSNPFETKMACSCSGYGVKRKENMPFNDDSNLYNSPLQKAQMRDMKESFEDFEGFEGFEVSNLPDGADCGVNREMCNRVCQSKMSHASGLTGGNNMPLLRSYQCGPQ
jgi:hypothetical protein